MERGRYLKKNICDLIRVSIVVVLNTNYDMVLNVLPNIDNMVPHNYSMVPNDMFPNIFGECGF